MAKTGIRGTAAPNISEIYEKKSRRTRRWIGVLLLVFLLMIGSAVLISCYLDRMIGYLNRVDGSGPTIGAEELESYKNKELEEQDPDNPGEILESEDITLETVGDAPSEEPDVINIMLIGHDARPGEGRARADTMLLCSFNKKTATINVVSFLRDLYVAIPEYGHYKMNAAYAWGDMNLLNQTVLHNFGVPIHGDIAVNFSSFQKVIDAIGGVEVELTASEARYLNPYRYQKGVNCLDGEMALKYARIRSIGDGDFDRTGRQQKVISGIMARCKTMSFGELDSMLQMLLPLLETNMTPEQLKGYAVELLPMIGEIAIGNKQKVPMDGTYQYGWVSGMSVLIPDLDQIRKNLYSQLYGE